MTARFLMAITFTSGPDALGRRSFTLRWSQDGRDRGQVFHMRPRDIVSRLRKQGHRVVTARRYAQLAAAQAIEVLDGRRTA